jgi:hypothetical protein
MKKLGFLLFLVLMLGIASGTGLAQNVGDNSVYFTTYFSNANTAGAPGAVDRFINDGDTEADLWADIYVFDDSEELTECCSCDITPDGLLSERVNEDLTSKPITGIKPTRGVIKVISSSVPGAAAMPPGIVVPTAGIRAWGVHVQKSGARYDVTETTFADSNLAASELVLLQELCFFDAKLSGKQCACTLEDQDF